jgi:hypothetical protein
MIVKHVPMRSQRKSSFAELGNYLADPRDHGERVGDVRVTNCYSDELPDALPEVMATQARNTRARGDKTYHLIISFRAGEIPPTEALVEIEERICIGLGLGEHQRVSAVHHDTDNLHIHIAINKIHPKRLTMHDPFRAYRSLAKLCTDIEQEFGLERDNHQATKHGAENRAADMEHATGIESLLGWAKRECLPQIEAAQSWTELHALLREKGLELRERGNGFVIASEDGTMIKASSISRDFSKNKLQTRFGAFENPPHSNPFGSERIQGMLETKQGDRGSLRKRYQPKPIQSISIDTSELYARYTAEQQRVQTDRTAEGSHAHADKLRKIETAMAANRLKRAAIKLLGGGRLTKKLLYAQAHRALRAEMDTIRKQCSRERKITSERHRRRSWSDWLQKQATDGNHQALIAMRVNAARQSLNGNTVAGQHRKNDTPLALPQHITKKGTLIYRVGKAAIRDDGERLQVSREATSESLQVALQLAVQRYGQSLTVNGSDEFKEQIARVAAVTRLAVCFDNPAIEKRRLLFLAAASQKPEHPTRNPGIRR